MPSPAPASPPTASASLWDRVLGMLPQTSGIMGASNALGMANSRADLSAQLAKLKAQGPVDGFHTKAWQDQMDALTQQISKAK